MRVLVACEESQRVTQAFRDKGHEAYSCDIMPTSGLHSEWHIQDDVLKHLEGWDLIIAHPPCTYLSNAGIRWFNEEKYGDKAVQRKLLREEALQFFCRLYNAPALKIAVENPVGYINSTFKKPDQIIQPYYFGDNESKRTCLWLKNLPKLTPTEIVEPKVYGVFKSGKNKGQPIYGNSWLQLSEDRAKLRSKTYWGIAKAMAEQWG